MSEQREQSGSRSSSEKARGNSAWARHGTGRANIGVEAINSGAVALPSASGPTVMMEAVDGAVDAAVGEELQQTTGAANILSGGPPNGETGRMVSVISFDVRLSIIEMRLLVQ